MSIDINFDKDIWSNCPSTITSLTNKSNIYNFHKAVFDSLIKDRSLKDIKELAKQPFLVSTEGKFLDLIGELHGLKRRIGESDESFKTRIKILKTIKATDPPLQGIQRKTIKKLLKFYDINLNIDSIDDEHDLAIRILKSEGENSNEDKSEKLSFITSPKGTWSRAYIRFFNKPGINIDLIKRVLDDIVEPYQGVYLMPYTGKEAIKKILDHYKLDYDQLERERNKETKKVHMNIKLKSKPNETTNKGLKSIEHLKSLLEERAFGYEYKITIN